MKASQIQIILIITYAVSKLEFFTWNVANLQATTKIDYVV